MVWLGTPLPRCPPPPATLRPDKSSLDPCCDVGRTLVPQPAFPLSLDACDPATELVPLPGEFLAPVNDLHPVPNRFRPLS